MGVALRAVSANPLNLEALVSAVSDASGRHGAVTTFLGVVRGDNLGRRVTHLEYEAYETLAVKVFERIAAEAAERWPLASVALHHRTGRLAIGEASVAIAVASPHRGDAFSACRYVIERVKQIAPVWKHEFFEGGDTWIEGATADPDDESAREAAFKRACA